MATILDTSELFFKSFEPKTKFRFKLLIDGLPDYLLKTASRPQISSTDIEIPYINLNWYAKGKTKWGGEFSTTLIDPIAPSGTQAIMEWVNIIHETLTGRDGYLDMFKKDAKLIILGPAGDIVETWTYKGLWPKDVNFGDVGWDADDIMTIDITFKYDYVILEF